MNEVKVTNMTSLFSKDMLIYSFFDLRLKQPLRVVGILYFIVLFTLIGIPTLIFAWPPNVYSLAFAVGLPFGGAMAMSKPIWNGKSFFSFAKTQYKYLSRTKVMFDWRQQSKDTLYNINSNILVSRQHDYNLLYNLVKEEEEAILNV